MEYHLETREGHEPPEVFVLLFRLAIDSAVKALRETGLNESQIWESYERALSELVRTTLDVEHESLAAAA